MSNAKNEALFDKRVVERNIQRGLITETEYESFLNDLEDCEEEVEEVEVRFTHKKASENDEDA